MFNLNTTLGIKFGTIGNKASVSVTFPDTVGANSFALMGGMFGSFFEVVTGGSTTPTQVFFGDFNNNGGNSNIVEHNDDEILFLSVDGQNTGTEWATSIRALIETVPKTGSLTATPRNTGFTPASIRRICEVTSNANVLTVTTDINVVTNITEDTVLGSTTTLITQGLVDTFIDERVSMASFSDNRVFTPASNTKALQIEFTKALNSIFIYLPTPSSTANTISSMTLIKPTGAQIPLTNFVDGTQGLTQSGFLYWEPERDVFDDFQSGVIYTLSIDYLNDISATFGGVNILFCDKFDLLREYPDLDSLLGISSESVISTQLIRIMESTMLEIEKKVQNSPFWKEDRQYFFTAKQLDRWDLLQINEINQAAIFWTLGKIFYFLSDSPGDIYSLKSGDYRARGETAFESVNLSLDFNDNGSLDVFEGEREADNIEITFER